MNRAAIAFISGVLLLLLAIAFLPSLGVALYYGSKSEVNAFLSAIGITTLIGFLLCGINRKKSLDLSAKDGFVIVAFGWVFLSAFGALPFVLADDGIPSYIDAFFETMSGFSTTGASILPEPESLPRGLMFWRSFTHWLGGMGIVVLTVAILPFLGAGGYQLMRAEVPGPTADKMTPRIAQTAKTLWLVYLALTVLQFLFLLPVMDWFDSCCHTFGTLATGGFSTRNGSLGDYNSVYIDWVVIAFMFLAGSNFVLHFHLLTGRGFKHFKDSEFSFYLSLIVLSTIFISLFLYAGSYPDKELSPEKYSSLAQCIRYGAFQVVSIITTTGYGTADFDGWPNSCRFLIVSLMFIGGCAGSTAGGIKCIRILVTLRFGVREIMHMVRPQEILPVRIGEQSIDRSVVARVMGFMALYFILFSLAVLSMTLILDLSPKPPESQAHAQAHVADHENAQLLTAFGTVIATMGNIGPGLAGVGPTKNFSAIPDIGKLVLVFCMLLGRLEIYCVLIMFLPFIWRR